MNARLISIFLFAILYIVIGFGTEAAKAAGDTGYHKPNLTWTFRVITANELEKVARKDMTLAPVSA